MFEWPYSLVQEIAERRCIAFIGAGFSRFAVGRDNSTKPPLWNEFLTRLKEHVHTGSERQFAQEFIDAERYLDAAEVIRANVLASEFNSLLQREFRDPGFGPARVHSHLRELDLKVVVTTNYDTIYDDFCTSGEGAHLFNVLKYHDDGLMDDLRSTRRLIVKAHGCAKFQQKTILSRSDYFRARRDCPAFFNILDALFTTNTLLFIGYGLGDPDIQLVLENVALRTPSACPHYIVTEAGRHPAVKRAMETSYNIAFLEHDAGDFDQIEGALETLVEKVVAERSELP